MPETFISKYAVSLLFIKHKIIKVNKQESYRGDKTDSLKHVTLGEESAETPSYLDFITTASLETRSQYSKVGFCVPPRLLEYMGPRLYFTNTDNVTSSGYFPGD